MRHFVVSYKDDSGYQKYSEVTEYFDSLSNLSAKTMAIALLAQGCSEVKICGVHLEPLYEITDSPPGIGPELRMRKIEKFQGEF